MNETWLESGDQVVKDQLMGRSSVESVMCEGLLRSSKWKATGSVEFGL